MWVTYITCNTLHLYSGSYSIITIKQKGYEDNKQNLMLCIFIVGLSINLCLLCICSVTQNFGEMPVKVLCIYSTTLTAETLQQKATVKMNIEFHLFNHWSIHLPPPLPSSRPTLPHTLLHPGQRAAGHMSATCLSHRGVLCLLYVCVCPSRATEHLDLQLLVKTKRVFCCLFQTLKTLTFNLNLIYQAWQRVASVWP